MTGPTLRALDLFLTLHPKPVAGYEIINQKNIFSGTLYPLLDRLVRAKWVTTEWEEGDPKVLGRPLRRYYRLTGLGVREAKKELLAHNIGVAVSGQPTLAPAKGGK